MGEKGQNSHKTYLVRSDILPEGIYKTALAKELLAKGDAKNIREATTKVGLSRSVYYKYRDGVFPVFQGEQMKTVTVLFWRTMKKARRQSGRI